MSATARCSRSLLLEIDGRSVTSRWTRSVRCDASYDAANLRFEGGLLTTLNYSTSAPSRLGQAIDRTNALASRRTPNTGQ
jgi:hypothetical protein